MKKSPQPTSEVKTTEHSKYSVFEDDPLFHLGGEDFANAYKKLPGDYRFKIRNVKKFASYSFNGNKYSSIKIKNKRTITKEQAQKVYGVKLHSFDHLREPYSMKDLRIFENIGCVYFNKCNLLDVDELKYFDISSLELYECQLKNIDFVQDLYHLNEGKQRLNDVSFIMVS